MRRDLIRVANSTIEYTKNYMKIHNDMRPQEVEVYSPDRIQAVCDDDEFFENHFRFTDGAKIYLANADSFEAAAGLDNALVLNFANAYNPGGGFLHGARAQEESLCRCSTLYESISSEKAKEMYDYNNSSLDPCASDYMLLSRHVLVFRDKHLNNLDTPFWTSVVTAPAPNLNGEAALVPQDTIDLIMLNRILSLFYLAARYGYRNLVLGAWGCGAFGHRTKNVAEYFRYLLIEKKYNQFFDNVVFAILNDENKISDFKSVFGDEIMMGLPE